MLVLSRKAKESIVIRHNITVIVQKVRGNRVWLAIEAPIEDKVIRSELEGIPQDATTHALETPKAEDDAPTTVQKVKAPTQPASAAVPPPHLNMTSRPLAKFVKRKSGR